MKITITKSEKVSSADIPIGSLFSTGSTHFVTDNSTVLYLVVEVSNIPGGIERAYICISGGNCHAAKHGLEWPDVTLVSWNDVTITDDI